MTMRRSKRKTLLEPIKQNLAKRLSNTDARLRRSLLRALPIVVGLFLVFAFFSGDFGFIRIAKLHFEKRHLETENQRLMFYLK